MTLRRALENSRNLATVQLLATGLDDSAELAATITVRDLLCHRPGLNSLPAVPSAAGTPGAPGSVSTRPEA